ncbi:MAG: hypothetical protein AAGH64_06610, partial [Planctomycetota bacterium]
PRVATLAFDDWVLATDTEALDLSSRGLGNDDACLLAGVRREPFKGCAINVGSGSPTSVRTLFETIRGLCARPGAEAEYGAEREGDARHSVADTSLAAELLGFRCETSLEEGLCELLVSKGVTPVNRSVGRG